MPGRRLLAIARLWLDEGSMERVLEPLVADWQREQLEAPPGLRWRVWLRAIVAFASSVVRVSARSVVRELAVPPSVRDAVVLSCAAAGTVAVIFTLSALGGRTSRHNPAIFSSVVLDLRSWPLLWRDVLHMAWGCWSVIACSVDATRHSAKTIETASS